jgi:glycosyltransferase involved in cell wall biosynthesis
MDLPISGPVAILHYAGPPQLGGVEITVAAHARFLSDRGVPVRILAGNGGDLPEGIEWRIVAEFGSRGDDVEGMNRELNQGIVTERFHALVERVKSQLTDALAGASLLIVHNVLTMHKNLALTTALDQLNGAGMLPPVVAWCHDFAWIDPVYESELHAGPPWDLLRSRWPEVSYVVVSRDRQGCLANLLGLAEDEIAVVPPGIDLVAFLKLEETTVRLIDRLGLLEADPLLLLPARITRRKNIELAVEITGALRNQGLAPRLLITGPPGPHNPTNAEYLADLRRVVRDSGARDAVAFLYDTPVSDSTMSDLYRLADALLFPSRAEGFGIPLLEAGLSGLPIFRSDIPVMSEVAPRAEVVFRLDESPEAIAGRIAAFLASDPRFELKRKVQRHYTWRAICEDRLMPLLDKAMSQ